MKEYAVELVDGAFTRSRERFDALLAGLGSPETAGITHADLEERIGCQGRELLRCLLQDHLDLRAAREVRHAAVTGADAVVRRTVEPDHSRALSSVFGVVRVTRMAYRARAAVNLYPADAVLNLPVEKHSHGLRRLAAVESVRGSFTAAGEAIGRVTGHGLGKRQVEALAQAVAVDIGAFYTARRPGPAPDGDVLVLSADGKGIVMRPEALREPTRKAAAGGGHKLRTRLSKGEKRNRKRMAEVGAVYDATPVVRVPEQIITRSGDDQPATRVKGPVARNKWLTASVEHDTTSVITAVFDEATRRDPGHRRVWLALVDGNAHQIDVIRAQARRCAVKVAIVLDFVHVLEYLWKAAWCFYKEGDKAAERWVADHARRVLAGRSGIVAAAIRRKATFRGLRADQRKNVDTTASYLLGNGVYLDYAQALRQGWPIATGVIEGACRHLVKDRMDITGARWGLTGAEAILQLRALTSNGDFDEYWKYHLAQERHRIHETRYTNNITLRAA
ncbi:MAG: ISKra4 family transposase [Actinomycetota bacterium]|nr:ISKra4 family transposase [Actinomycetota bacterium]